MPHGITIHHFYNILYDYTPLQGEKKHAFGNGVLPGQDDAQK